MIDYAKIRVEGGRGGSGCVSFRREKHVPRGGPNGGDGGNGGDVTLVVDPRKRTLLEFRFTKRFAAGAGGHGMGKEMDGAGGKDAEVSVPAGTIVKDSESGEVLADLTEAGQRIVLARGGRGGRGNRRFKTSTNRAPRDWEPGGPGEERALVLELRLLADAGLVGSPNAGKSTLLSRVSAARPKIADYPFTTLEPYLGVVAVGDFDSFILADIPGIIEGASQGKGLGLEFLRHIERTSVLVFVIDATQPDPARELDMLRAELETHDRVLASRPSIVALNKIDILGPGGAGDLPKDVGGTRAIPISAVTGEGVGALLFAIHALVPVLVPAPAPVPPPDVLEGWPERSSEEEGA